MQHTEAVRKLGEMIKGIRVAMLTTVDDDGTLRSRPMATQEAEFDGQIWFFTGINSAKTHEIEKDHRVNLSYAKPDEQHYVSVSGTARVVRDRAKAAELWNPMLRAWFPKGLDDPDMALICVDVDKAEYWDSPSSTMVHLYGVAKAMLTGERPNPGDNQKVEL